MEHIGIDLGAKKSNIVVCTASGDIVTRQTVPTSQLNAWLRMRPPGRVVMESCTQSRAVAQISRTAGHETVVIPANLVRSLGVGFRGIKTDDRDAEVLSRASVRNETLPTVYVRSPIAESHRELLGQRTVLVDSRKRMVTHVKSWLRARLLQLSSGGQTKSFSARVRELALSTSDGLPLGIEAMLTSIEALSTQIEQLDAEAERIAETHPVCTRLMTVPGIGPIISLAFVAHIDDLSRFETPGELASYLALVPGEASTGGRTQRTSTLRAGPSHLKALLVQGAWSLWRTRPNDPAVVWARQIAEKRGRRIAIVALARKLSSILFAMWKTQTPYRPKQRTEITAAAIAPAAPAVEVAMTS